MKLKLVISLLAVVSVPTFFSSCTNVESKNSDEVVIDRSSTSSSDEVFITNSDVKSQKQLLSTMQKRGGQLEKRVLSDKSEIETLIDGFGNKVETRFFPGHPRLRLLVLRTSLKGQQEVTVYGNGGVTKIVNELADRALSASGDEIANAAQLTATASYGAARNFMKRNSTAAQQQPLQPLPSSAFQKPQTPVNQPVGTVQPETSASNEKPVTQQNNPEED
jgi:hypothetical protein